ncbi:MAG: hypothetical protein ACKOET_06630, partial [Verrucomicrobiota bacterium]
MRFRQGWWTAWLLGCSLGADSPKSPLPAPAASSAGVSAAAAAWPPARVDTWLGFRRRRFEVAGGEAWVVEPAAAAPGRPWTWCLEFPDAFTERTGV